MAISTHDQGASRHRAGPHPPAPRGPVTRAGPPAARGLVARVEHPVAIDDAPTDVLDVRAIRPAHRRPLLVAGGVLLGLLVLVGGVTVGLRPTSWSGLLGGSFGACDVPTSVLSKFSPAMTPRPDSLLDAGPRQHAGVESCTYSTTVDAASAGTDGVLILEVTRIPNSPAGSDTAAYQQQRRKQTAAAEAATERGGPRSTFTQLPKSSLRAVVSTQGGLNGGAASCDTATSYWVLGVFGSAAVDPVPGLDAIATGIGCHTPTG